MARYYPDGQQTKTSSQPSDYVQLSLDHAHELDYGTTMMMMMMIIIIVTIMQHNNMSNMAKSHTWVWEKEWSKERTRERRCNKWKLAALTLGEKQAKKQFSLSLHAEFSMQICLCLKRAKTRLLGFALLALAKVTDYAHSVWSSTRESWTWKTIPSPLNSPACLLLLFRDASCELRTAN